jgi:O-antigen ligase
MNWSLFQMLFVGLILSTFLSIAGMGIFSGLIFLYGALVWFLEKRGSFRVEPHQRLMWIVLFTFGLWATLRGFAASPGDGLNALIFQKWILPVWALSFFFQRAQKTAPNGNPSLTESRSTRALFLVTTCICLIGAYAVVQMYLRIDIARDTNQHLSPFGNYFRATGFLKNALTFAYVLGLWMCWPLATLLTWDWTRRKANLLFFFLLLAVLLGFAGIFASFTRGAWIGMLVALMVMAFYSHRQSVVPMVLSLLVVAAGLVNSETFQSRISTVFDVSASGYNFERLGVWRGYFEIVKDYPVGGVGWGNARKLLPIYYERIGFKSDFFSHAHNDLLQITADLGVIGLSLFVLFAFLSFRKAHLLILENPQGPQRTMAIAATGALVLFYVGGLTQANFIDSEVRHVMTVVWAFLLSAPLLKKAKRPSA